jgi:ribosomal RNA-processing protein 8
MQTPLEPSSADVAIFCLSLMGTNYASYLEEANRVLKPRSA